MDFPGSSEALEGGQPVPQIGLDMGAEVIRFRLDTCLEILLFPVLEAMPEEEDEGGNDDEKRSGKPSPPREESLPVH